MNRGIERTLAVLMGTSAGIVIICLTFVVVLRDQSFALLPDFFHRVTIPLDTSAPPDGSSSRLRTLNVTRSTTGQVLLEPLLDSHVSDDHTTLRASYSGHWSERRIVALDLHRGSARVLASFETDYGTFPGWVAVADSSINVQIDEVCFDLRVRRLDGSSEQERWIGSIPRR
jgi:hypothetical protein